jgi:2-polyprenyl-3-methyl-5-hydroxy-6-metoxy-1,4-benzoquinol methylase
MSFATENPDEQATAHIAQRFDELYENVDRYWWRTEGRYSLRAEAYPYSLLTQMTLRLTERQGNRSRRRVLDLGAGEGADAIRLALLGYRVTAVEVSSIAAAKIRRFAAEANANVEVALADLNMYQPDGKFDIVICNGVLQYIQDKKPVIERMQHATRPGGINVISVWSTYSAVPPIHQLLPAFCDDEDGVVTGLYSHWKTEFIYFDRNKLETAHATSDPHMHSHIKLIARKPRHA